MTLTVNGLSVAFDVAVLERLESLDAVGGALLANEPSPKEMPTLSTTWRRCMPEPRTQDSRFAPLRHAGSGS